jgi:hypothetical protein
MPDAKIVDDEKQTKYAGLITLNSGVSMTTEKEGA